MHENEFSNRQVCMLDHFLILFNSTLQQQVYFKLSIAYKACARKYFEILIFVGQHPERVTAGNRICSKFKG